MVKLLLAARTLLLHYHRSSFLLLLVLLNFQSIRAVWFSQDFVFIAALSFAFQDFCHIQCSFLWAPLLESVIFWKNYATVLPCWWRRCNPALYNAWNYSRPRITCLRQLCFKWDVPAAKHLHARLVHNGGFLFVTIFSVANPFPLKENHDEPLWDYTLPSCTR